MPLKSFAGAYFPVKPTVQHRTIFGVGIRCFVVRKSGFVLSNDVEQINSGQFDGFHKVLVSWKMEVIEILQSSTITRTN